MTTNNQLITRAYREINVINEVQSPSAEQSDQALTKLNGFMELWKEDNVDPGWFKQTDLTATAPIPDWMEEGVMLTLAARLCPQYGASLSVEAAAALDSFKRTIVRKGIKERLDNADMSHMPIGQGHFDSRYDIQNDT